MPRIAKALLIVFSIMPLSKLEAQEPKRFRLPDERYKVDLLLVVAHPTDEGAATPYLARALDDTGAWQSFLERAGAAARTKPERSKRQRLVRSARLKRATPSQRWGLTMYGFSAARIRRRKMCCCRWQTGIMGESLEQLVRLVRLTRLKIILTFLPGTFIGEDHGDHQASGILATEALIWRAIPAAFPEQVAGPTKRLEPFTREPASLAAKKDLLLSRCRPAKISFAEGTRLFGERNLQIEQTSILANGARFVPFPPDTSQVLSG